MRRRSQAGGILGILMGLLALAAVAVACLVLVGLYVARNVRVEVARNVRENVGNRASETVLLDTPVGSMKIQPHQRLDPKAMGIPVYPGAVREDRDTNGASFEFDFNSSHKEFTVIGAEYSTSDSLDRVRNFYHQELPNWIISQSRRGHFKIEYTEDGYKRFVVLSERHGRTRIGLASVGEPASN
jgi:hypothetical protein